jgi:hypothetical protein
LSNVVLTRGDHADMTAALPAGSAGGVGAVMFNLGYRPGGDKSFATSPASSRTALGIALRLLRPGGVLTVVAYSGHPGGAEETAVVQRFMESMPTGYSVRETGSESATGPTLFVCERASARE